MKLKPLPYEILGNNVLTDGCYALRIIERAYPCYTVAFLAWVVGATLTLDEHQWHATLGEIQESGVPALTEAAHRRFIQRSVLAGAQSSVWLKAGRRTARPTRNEKRAPAGHRDRRRHAFFRCPDFGESWRAGLGAAARERERGGSGARRGSGEGRLRTAQRWTGEGSGALRSGGERRRSDTRRRGARRSGDAVRQKRGESEGRSGVPQQLALADRSAEHAQESISCAHPGERRDTERPSVDAPPAGCLGCRREAVQGGKGGEGRWESEEGRSERERERGSSQDGTSDRLGCDVGDRVPLRGRGCL